MDKGKTFRLLHEGRDILIMPNPWDPGTAKYLASLGFKALATTSAGFAFSRGLPDGGVPFDAMMQHCREMVAATDLPISADLEKGKGDSADSAAETIFAAEAAGLAGCSIEDFSGDAAKPIYDFDHAVERVAAAAEAARALKGDFVFTARCENFLHGITDFDATVKRLQAFERAGADVLFAPGISDPARLRELCAAVSKPVSTIAPAGLSVPELTEIGISRLSLGSRLTTAAFTALHTAAREMLDKGTFEFNRSGVAYSELQGLFSRNGDS
ncbi:isocitrate lyase/phosphoenolpyruvate mutase family protein [Phyllobacterium sp. 21LDTY02-6]|jgi:2-methylisocitrate lyase-like PEP mutase family enzyme|uniref:isocitrate lyase/PEP mutase family protein n=1 Tax=unclassified Phyllobacterium TaxID=2638441 RepID=UPI00202043E0|nr:MULTISPECIES: isocitrate lyase/phosphoenolpyruvate mutase family protein [unclassified Phyllobacterium]MCO4317080.1 isocitrate lyase/phosphoenolpyruvate mutase family protein [Phyllobacterium sp. 21LDTY02-6]MCX8278644.1 isocitrate lyase/phosphoenolpyruvate mutase family protein [Phyllobacterium sp. 0TCS1.6C]MCX8293526.1 isocitrate lyase/phosphoenolpyruvate mutase family protein [Phyllobacterium sp. 0TCS1.6A]